MPSVFLKTQTVGLPGKVMIQVTPPRSALPACSALDAFQPAGSRGIGKITVGVRCLAPSQWTVYLPAPGAGDGPLRGDPPGAARQPRPDRRRSCITRRRPR
jgi:hypothetical protein